MTYLYFDAFSGAGGDMIVGALVDLGVDARHVRNALRSLGFGGLKVTFRAVSRAGIGATKFDVKAPGRPPHRGLEEIRRILRRADLTPGARAIADSAITRQAEAEARVHRIPVEKVQLHEVGAIDSIADVVGAAVCLDRLAADRVVVSALPLGSGRVECEHGTFPVPAPATLELLRGRPVRPGPVAAEMVTPTAAAILTAVADGFGPMPRMVPGRIGHGAGSRDPEGLPNVLRVVEGEPDPAEEAPAEVIEIQANLDDMNPQVYGHLMDRLFEQGALEVFYTPVHMKKNRPGVLVTAITREAAREALTEVLFRDSSTIGVRWRAAARRELDRESVEVRIRGGNVSVKVSKLAGEVVQVSPEYDDCVRIARRRGAPLRTVQEEAVEAYRKTGEERR